MAPLKHGESLPYGNVFLCSVTVENFVCPQVIGYILAWKIPPIIDRFSKWRYLYIRSISFYKWWVFSYHLAKILAQGNPATLSSWPFYGLCLLLHWYLPTAPQIEGQSFKFERIHLPQRINLLCWFRHSTTGENATGLTACFCAKCIYMFENS